MPLSILGQYLLLFPSKFHKTYLYLFHFLRFLASQIWFLFLPLLKLALPQTSIQIISLNTRSICQTLWCWPLRTLQSCDYCLLKFSSLGFYGFYGFHEHLSWLRPGPTSFPSQQSKSFLWLTHQQYIDESQIFIKARLDFCISNSYIQLHVL